MLALMISSWLNFIFTYCIMKVSTNTTKSTKKNQTYYHQVWGVLYLVLALFVVAVFKNE